MSSTCIEIMDINHLSTWLGVYLNDLMRYLLFAGTGFLIFWMVFKKKIHHRFIQGIRPESSKMVSEFTFSMLTVFIFSLIGFGINISTKAGWTKIYFDVNDFGWTWLVSSVLIMILFHDFYFYWTHRWMHHKKIYKHVHRVHHLSTNPSPWAAYSFHPWEALIQALVLPLIVFTIPSHPIAITAFLIYMITRNVLGHLGYELFPRGFTKNKWLKWHNTSTHHNMHHKHFDCNYGLYFSWWDDWMKTTHKEYSDAFEEVVNRTKSDVKRTSTLSENVNKAIIFLIIIFAYPTFVPAQSAVGKWVTFDERSGDSLAVIKISKSTDGIYGCIDRIVVNQHQGLDPICTYCEGNMKDKKVVGMDFLWGFKRNEDSWVDGRILDPSNGEVYQSKMWLENDTLLKVRGYGGPFNIFFRTQNWIRSENNHPQNNDILGFWKTIDDRTGLARSIVNIRSEQGELKAKIVKLFYLPDEGPDPICLACEGSLKNSKIVGMKMLWGFEQVSKNEWTNGQIMDPANGKTYSSKMWLTSEKLLTVRGYWGPFYRTQVWQKLP